LDKAAGRVRQSGGVPQKETAMPDPVSQAVDLLLAARRDLGHRLPGLPDQVKPKDRGTAYDIQHRIATTYSAIGGWKVGAPGPEAPPQCGALPEAGIVISPASLSSRTHVLRGIEAEIAFRMARDLPPRPGPYSRDEVIGAIEAAYPVIEVLESGYLDPDAVDPLSNLADTQSHGGLVYGAPQPFWQDIDFAAEKVEQYVDGALQMERVGNPCGDMIRLVVWMANEGSHWAGGLKRGQFVTCGSWTGKSVVGPDSTVRVVFPSVGEVVVSYTV
jgi:2-keto-4-pentenoate hydratase